VICLPRGIKHKIDKKGIEMSVTERIKHLRQKIETLNDQILGLLNERAKIAQEVGQVKANSRMDSYVPQREEEILQRLVERNSGPFPKSAISSVFREIISACRSLEAELKVAYLGPPATHTHLAVIKQFGSSACAVPEDNFQDIFEAVEREKANLGVVPIENSIEGSVDPTLDLLIDFDVKIYGEILSRVSHDLLSKTSEARDIQKIYSHPQALGQCRQWLRKNLPQIPLVETVSTAKAAKIASEDVTAAAIATSFAGQLYGLKVLTSHIEDYSKNYTRFLVLSRKSRSPTGKDKTSILFSIPHTPGSLFRALETFSKKEVNLTKIESRPLKGRPWEYIFFLDFEGHVEDPNIDEAMTTLKKNTLFMKFLGSYPRSSLEETE
jgi:chorismate mutase/prephenate dehydratase